MLLVANLGQRPARGFSARNAVHPARHMHVSEVKPGNEGAYGPQRLQRTKIEKFGRRCGGCRSRIFNPEIRCHPHSLSPRNSLKNTGPIEGMERFADFLYDDTGRARMIGRSPMGGRFPKHCLAGCAAHMNTCCTVHKSLAAVAAVKAVAPAQCQWDVPLTRRAWSTRSGSASAVESSNQNWRQRLIGRCLVVGVTNMRPLSTPADDRRRECSDARENRSPVC